MKTLRIFFRDLKTAFRHFILTYIFIAPLILSAVIGAATSQTADTPVRVAMLRGGEGTEYFERYAALELFGTVETLENRVSAHDDIIGVIGDEIIVQGDEPQFLIDAVYLLNTYRAAGIVPDESRAEFHDFGRTNPPLKITLTTSLVLLVTVMSGMIIAINIVDEKADRTIRAIRVAPVSLNSFVIGKCIIGVVNSIVCGVLAVLLAGFTGVNFLHVLLIVIAASFISFIFGFLAGLNSTDFVSASASLKLLMIPMAGSILAAELLSENLQWLFYWSPFYWAYNGINGVLAQTAVMGDILLNAGITLVITAAAYAAMYPKIRKKLV